VLQTQSLQLDRCKPASPSRVARLLEKKKESDQMEKKRFS
jgi:hypothetical protein